MATNREKCIEMWEWIAGQPDGTAKYDFFNHTGQSWSEVPDSQCYACQEVEENKGDEDNCFNCPIYPRNYLVCGEPGQPYHIWYENRTQKNAATFLKFIKENWKE